MADCNPKGQCWFPLSANYWLTGSCSSGFINKVSLSEARRQTVIKYFPGYRGLRKSMDCVHSMECGVCVVHVCTFLGTQDKHSFTSTKNSWSNDSQRYGPSPASSWAQFGFREFKAFVWKEVSLNLSPIV